METATVRNRSPWKCRQFWRATLFKCDPRHRRRFYRIPKASLRILVQLSPSRLKRHRKPCGLKIRCISFWRNRSLRRWRDRCTLDQSRRPPRRRQFRKRTFSKRSTTTIRPSFGNYAEAKRCDDSLYAKALPSVFCCRSRSLDSSLSLKIRVCIGS